MEVKPIVNIRFDDVSHLPVFDDNKDSARCKQGSCLKKRILLVENVKYTYVLLAIETFFLLYNKNKHIFSITTFLIACQLIPQDHHVR